MFLLVVRFDGTIITAKPYQRFFKFQSVFSTLLAFKHGHDYFHTSEVTETKDFNAYFISQCHRRNQAKRAWFLVDNKECKTEIVNVRFCFINFLNFLKYNSVLTQMCMLCIALIEIAYLRTCIQLLWLQLVT